MDVLWDRAAPAAGSARSEGSGSASAQRRGAGIRGDLASPEAATMTVREVAEALQERDLAYTTVMTVLDRLAGKGMVEREREGRAWSYRPAATREAYIAQLMLDALDLAGSPESGSRASRGNPDRVGRDAALVRFARSVTGTEAEVLRAALTDEAAEG